MLKEKLEALLFSSGRKMDVEELSRLSDAKTEDIQKSLEELKKEYEDKKSSVMIVNEGDSWKSTVREEFLPLVQKIITETELSKTIMETLAVIAFKYPIKQSNLIKIRTNKAYDHLKELEEMGYITRQKHGRTNLIKLTQKFFEYFDLPEQKLKEVFKDFASIAKAIEVKETEIKQIKEEQKASAEEEKNKDENIKKEIDLMGEEGQKVPLETYESKEKLGNLEVVNASEKSEKENLENREEKPKSEGIKLSKEEEKIVDEKVEKILHPEKEEKEETSESENARKSKISGINSVDKEKNKSEEEPKDFIEAEMEEKEDKKEN